jgi:hypothetical protein
MTAVDHAPASGGGSAQFESAKKLTKALGVEVAELMGDD